MSLLNKVALVTGASSGIGAAIAVKLAEQGARVAIIGRNKAKLKNTSDNCQKHGEKPLTIVADITEDEKAKEVVNKTLNTYGKLDILVNNAGIVDSARILDKNTMKVFDRIMAINLRAVVNMTHLAAEYLVQSKGNIVNISSAASKVVLAKSNVSYSITKAGLDHFTRYIAADLGEHGVRVNAINPGPTKTDALLNAGIISENSDEFWNNYKFVTAINRIGEPGDIAELVSFKVSDKAIGITGAIIANDNGTVLHGYLD